MKFGMVIPTLGALAAGNGAMEAHLTIAQRAEALGYDSLWAPDHVVFPTTINSKYPYNDTGKLPFSADIPLLEPIAALGVIAGATKRVRLGTWVLVLPHRNPIVTAKMWATLDVMSGGRMILGAGIGWMAEEIELLGAPYNKRGALSDEYIRAMRELWTSSDPQFHGQYVNFSGIKCEPKPIQKPFPVWIGGHSARAMRRVVELGDGWLAVPKSYQNFQETSELLARAAKNAGRDPRSVPVMIGTLYADSVDSSIADIKKYQALGYDNFIAPVPFWAPDLKGVLSVMEDFARKVKM
jgi:probable F420-dependent oxidoreductase